MRYITLLRLTLLSFTCSFFSTYTLAGSPNQSSEKNEDWHYSVLKNDSFERIYKQYLVKRANILELSEYNHHKLTKKLQPNQILNIPVRMIKRTPTAAHVLVVSGDVNVITSTGKQKLSAKDLLNAGASVQTGKNSLAKIRFADDSITDLQPNSTLVIKQSYVYVGKGTYVTQLKLSEGRTAIEANPNHTLGNTMEVETPSAIAAVRGTQFRVGAEGELALQETLDGQVAFQASGQEVLLDKGYGTAAEKDKAPLPPIVLPDAPNVSAFIKVFDSVPVEFNLIAQADAVAWVSQLAADDKFTKILNEQQVLADKTTQEVLSFGDLADGEYYLRLRAKEQHGLQGQDAIHAFSVKARPLPPQLIEPLDDAVISDASIGLSWTSVANANNYIVQIARDVQFEDKVFERVTSFNKLTVTQALASGEFYWRVATLNKGKPQKFSKSRKFAR